jgi:hypothetical protein
MLRYSGAARASRASGRRLRKRPGFSYGFGGHSGGYSVNLNPDAERVDRPWASTGVCSDYFRFSVLPGGEVWAVFALSFAFWAASFASL